MSDAPRIEVEHVSKRYVKYDDAPLLLSRVFGWRQQTTRSKLWALKDIDFTVSPGECIGVIGHNGSGKSTLLRLLAGVTGPTEGRVKVRGRIAPLISVGVGFHMELTGRENVFANGTILGLAPSEIERRLPEIVDFAEIGKFIDTPVKFYSSGMFMRLGFAVSVLAAPDVLLVDEVLSVGDIGFQRKCLERMMDIKEAGTTIVIVSHNLGAIRRMCDRTVVLHGGQLRHDGDTVEAISTLHHLLNSRSDADDPEYRSYHSTADDAGEVTAFELLGPSGYPTRHVRSQDDVCLRMDVAFHRPAGKAVAGIMVWNEYAVLYQDVSPLEQATSFAEGDVVRVEARFKPGLRAGSYMARLALVQEDETVVAQSVALDFFVDGSDQFPGVVDLAAGWSVTELATEPGEGTETGEVHARLDSSRSLD